LGVTYIQVWEPHLVLLQLKNHFKKGNWYSVGDEIDKIPKISDSVDHPKRWGVTYWVENNMPLFVQIIDQFQKRVMVNQYSVNMIGGIGAGWIAIP
jgi:hypothetical protein